MPPNSSFLGQFSTPGKEEKLAILPWENALVIDVRHRIIGLKRKKVLDEEGDYEVFSISSSHKAIILRLEEVKESKKNHESEEGEKLKEDKGSEGRKEFEGDLKLEGDKKSEGDKKFKVALYRDESYEEAPECVRTRQWEGIRWIGSIHLDKLNLGEMYHAIDDMDPLSIATEDSGMKRFRRRRKLPPWLKASQALPNQILPTLAASETLTGGENKS